MALVDGLLQGEPHGRHPVLLARADAQGGAVLAEDHAVAADVHADVPAEDEVLQLL